MSSGEEEIESSFSIDDRQSHLILMAKTDSLSNLEDNDYDY